MATLETKDPLQSPNEKSIDSQRDELHIDCVRNTDSQSLKCTYTIAVGSVDMKIGSSDVALFFLKQ